MNTETGGNEEQGPSGVPYVNDPEKPANAGKEKAETGTDEYSEETEQ